MRQLRCACIPETFGRECAKQGVGHALGEWRGGGVRREQREAPPLLRGDRERELQICEPAGRIEGMIRRVVRQPDGANSEELDKRAILYRGWCDDGAVPGPKRPQLAISQMCAQLAMASPPPI